MTVKANTEVNGKVNIKANKIKRAYPISKITPQICSLIMCSSRDGGIRTHDLQHPMLARYRATLHPERAANLKKIANQLNRNKKYVTVIQL